MRALLSGRFLAVAVGLLLICGLGGCAAPQGKATSALTHRAAATVPPAPWWRSAGDPLLTRLIEHGLDADTRLRDEAAALTRAEAHARTWHYRVATWFGAIVGRPPENFDAAALHLARARQRKAEAIALSYVEIRRLQAVLTLRQDFQAQFSDDARIAQWRREAGLVSAVDGGLAATLIGVNADALHATDASLATARATLARQTGVAAPELEQQLGAAATLPDPTIGTDVETTATAADRAALDSTAARATALHAVQHGAERTAADARTAYQLGSGDFATVYVAETALLQVRDATIAARAAHAVAAIRLRADAALAAIGRTPGSEERSGD